jgi:hypothetical protein
MTVASSTSPINHTSDAGFRAWGSEFAAKLAAVGMVQTADTGQINWTTVTRPGGGTMAGYEIWRFANSFIYIKFQYGTGASANQPEIQSQAGSGSNGSGTLTGQTDTNAGCTAQLNPDSTVTNYTSRWCHIDSAAGAAFSVSWKEISCSSGTANMGFLVYGQTMSPVGLLTTGFQRVRMALTPNVSVRMQSVRFIATAATFNDVCSVIVPGDPQTSSTASTGAQQAYWIPMNVPDVIPFSWACTVLIGEAARGSTLSVAMVSAANHTYISPGQILSGANYGPYSPNFYTCAMIYE